MEPWDPEAEMELSAAIGEGGYGLFGYDDVCTCGNCGNPVVLSHHTCPTGTLYGRGRMFIRSGQEADVMMYFADGPFVAERFILRYRGGVWVDLFARCLVIDEGHFTFWVDFDLVPERAELAASFGEGDLDALDLARWLDGPFRRLAPTLDQTERANLIESVATALGVDINLNADDDDDEWDPDDDWEPEEPWDDDARVRGIVKFFDPEQRFGFIVPADGGADVFFHASDVAGPPLTTADRVRFEAVQGFGSTKAKNVERIDTSTVADPWAGGVTSVGWDGDEPPF